jgi:quinol monooxygenase YgiN
VYKTVLASFDVLPGCEGAIERLATAMSHQISSEPGNISIILYRQQDQPETYLFYEVYADQDAFQEHLAAAYVTAFNDAIVNLVAGGRSKVTHLVQVS